MGTLAHAIRLAFTILLTPAGLPGSEAECPVGQDRSLIIDLSLQVALFREEGTERNLTLVSSGREGNETPTGRYRVLYRRWAPVSSTYMVRMPYWICIEPSGELGLHECTPELVDRLGMRSSHGCVRLGPNTADWAYGWLPDSAEVLIRE